jgi:hypothetical protein
MGAAQVDLVCLECRAPHQKDSMLAQEAEVKEAEAEGVVIHPELGVNQILVKDGRVTGLQGMDCLSVRSAEGRFAPEFDEACTPTFLDADTVIAALGQSVDAAMLPSGGTLEVNPRTLQTSDPRVFAGGDAVTGPRDAISAIARGKAAALSIQRYLQGQDVSAGRTSIRDSVVRESGKSSPRPESLAAGNRQGFAEVDGVFDHDSAAEQAQRCLRCGTLVPSLVIRPEMPKRQIVPWDAGQALALWQKRNPVQGENLPLVYTEIEDVLRLPEPGITGRDRLVLKPKNVAEALRFTTDDE